MRRLSPRILLVASILAPLVSGAALRAERFVVVESDSIFAVITHKAGIASGLAHNHFVVASQLSLVLDFDPDEPMSTSFRLEAAIEDLIVDGPGRHQRWSDRLQQLSILGEGPKELSAKNRAKIREAMLGRRQLDVATFPTLSVELVGFEKSPARLGSVDFPYSASIEVELHGKSLRLDAASRYEWDGETLSIEAVAVANFSDFGIEPYSAMLGAVKNQDRFHFFLSLRAKSAAIVLDVPAAVPAGQRFEVHWRGPDGDNDYLTVVPSRAPDGERASYAYTSNGPTVHLVAPIDGGDYEVRYQSDRKGGVFARAPIAVLPIVVHLDAPEVVDAGSDFSVTWQGPDGHLDYITVVPASAEEGAYAGYRYTTDGSPLYLRAPDEPGDYELRYQSDHEAKRVFGRRPIRVR